jgi:hypothetical protein
MQSQDEGFAGGSEKIDCSGTQVGVPVIYEYSEVDGAFTWRLSYKGDCGHPGFVGAIAWSKAENAAVAVGGTGSYPYREPAYGQDINGNACPTDGEPNTLPYGAHCDQAGSGLAWRFTLSDRRSRWQPLSTPPGMRGLTAISFQDTIDRDLGFAGALGQLWRWQDGGFDGQRYDQNSPTADMLHASRFVFRVRQIKFTGGGSPIAFAVTDGCCAGVAAGSPGDPTHAANGGEFSSDPQAGQLDNAPRLLGYTEVNGSGDRIPGYWSVETIDAASSVLSNGESSVSPGGPSTSLNLNGPAARLNSRQDMPDSFYSLMVSSANLPFGPYQVSAIASTGGTPAAETGPERPSVITQPYCVWPTGGYDAFNLLNPELLVPDQVIEALRASLTTARLVAGAGDLGGQNIDQTSPAGLSASLCTGAGSGVPDWAVGELRSTNLLGLGREGLGLSTILRPPAANPPDTSNADTVAATTSLDGVQSMTSSGMVSAYARSQYFLLDSYSLNAIDVISRTTDGWAVGEHGAIVHVGGGQVASSGAREPPAPQLSHGAQSSSSDVSAFALFGPRALSRRPGVVPGLDTQPTEWLTSPALVSTGIPDASHEAPSQQLNANHYSVPAQAPTIIVASRDGSQAWALGSPTTDPTDPGLGGGGAWGAPLFFYDRHGWRRCNPVAIPELAPANPACSSLRAVFAYRDRQSNYPVRITAVARIPTENGSDPATARDFEIFAVGTLFARDASAPEQHVVLRYADGRWAIDQEAMAQLDSALRPAFGSGEGFDVTSVAFTSPGDGWLVASSASAVASPVVLHFDGHAWVNCGSGADAQRVTCADPSGELPLTTGISTADEGLRPQITVMASGGRVYIYGARTVQSGVSSVTSGTGQSFPMVIYRDPGRPWTDHAGGYDPLFDYQQQHAGLVDPNGGDEGSGLGALGRTQCGRVPVWLGGEALVTWWGPTQMWTLRHQRVIPRSRQCCA